MIELVLPLIISVGIGGGALLGYLLGRQSGLRQGVLALDRLYESVEKFKGDT